MTSPLSLQNPGQRLDQKIKDAQQIGGIKLNPEEFDRRVQNADPKKLGLAPHQEELMAGLQAHMTKTGGGAELEAGAGKTGHVSPEKGKDLGGR